MGYNRAGTRLRARIKRRRREEERLAKKAAAAAAPPVAMPPAKSKVAPRRPQE
jgi:hypothetical protein